MQNSHLLELTWFPLLSATHPRSSQLKPFVHLPPSAHLRCPSSISPPFFSLLSSSTRLSPSFSQPSSLQDTVSPDFPSIRAFVRSQPSFERAHNSPSTSISSFVLTFLPLLFACSLPQTSSSSSSESSLTNSPTLLSPTVSSEPSSAFPSLSTSSGSFTRRIDKAGSSSS